MINISSVTCISLCIFYISECGLCMEHQRNIVFADCGHFFDNVTRVQQRWTNAQYADKKTSKELESSSHKPFLTLTVLKCIDIETRADPDHLAHNCFGCSGSTLLATWTCVSNYQCSLGSVSMVVCCVLFKATSASYKFETILIRILYIKGPKVCPFYTLMISGAVFKPEASNFNKTS